MPATPQLVLEDWPLDKIRPYAKNPKSHAPKAVQRLARSMSEYGVRQPIVVDQDGVIILGHRRLLAARSLGMATYPVHQAHELSPQQVRAFRIADNRLSEDSGWDESALLAEVQEIGDSSFLGFDEAELAKLLAETLEQGVQPEPEYPIAPELNERYSYVVVLTENETDWVFLQELLDLRPEKSNTSKSVGLGRAVRFGRFMEAIRAWKLQCES